MELPTLSPEQTAVFFPAVWEVVRQVPAGRVTTYGQVGELVAPPPGIGEDEYRLWRARWVGQAMAACPADVPWQRVINAGGQISPRRGADLQRRLLELEGVIFDHKGRIDLKKVGWPEIEPLQPGLF